MVSSLDKLTQKLKNNLLDVERKAKINQGTNNNLNITRVNSTEKSQSQTLLPKRFIAENTHEVLYVASDGCYAYKTDSNGNDYLHRLTDIREILEGSDLKYVPVIKPGDSAGSTPT